jgi:hypothetical protein
LAGVVHHLGVHLQRAKSSAGSFLIGKPYDFMLKVIADKDLNWWLGWSWWRADNGDHNLFDPVKGEEDQCRPE